MINVIRFFDIFFLLSYGRCVIKRMLLHKFVFMIEQAVKVVHLTRSYLVVKESSWGINNLK